jgi:hypothetical protein
MGAWRVYRSGGGKTGHECGRLAEGHHSAECGTLESRWLQACRDAAISDHDWTAGRAAGAEDSNILAVTRARGGLTGHGVS